MSGQRWPPRVGRSLARSSQWTRAGWQRLVGGGGTGGPRWGLQCEGVWAQEKQTKVGAAHNRQAALGRSGLSNRRHAKAVSDHEKIAPETAIWKSCRRHAPALNLANGAGGAGGAGIAGNCCANCDNSQGTSSDSASAHASDTSGASCTSTSACASCWLRTLGLSKSAGRQNESDGCGAEGFGEIHDETFKN